MNDFVKNKIPELVMLCEMFEIKTMYLFGSAVTEFFTDQSDIDILISFKDLPFDKYTDNYFKLLEKLYEFVGGIFNCGNHVLIAEILFFLV
jgi:predicted nucleotidyltransferase